MKIPREKEGGKTNIVCVYIYIWLPLGGEVAKEKKHFFLFSSFSPLLALLCTWPLPDGRLPKVAKECPESHEDPLGKGGKTNIVCVYLRGEVAKERELFL